MSGLRKEFALGVSFMAIAKYSGFFINLIVLSIVARVLPPELFGTVSIATILIGFFGLLSDFGIASAIIQNQGLKKLDYDNIYSFTLYGGAILVILYLIALGPVYWVYRSAELLQICLFLVIQVFFSTLNIVPNALLLKGKRFKFIAARTVVIQLIGGIAAVISALSGLGIYSLIVSPILTSVLLFVVNRSQFSLILRLSPNRNSLNKIISYSTHSFVYNIVNYFSRNLDKFVLGKAFSFQALGYYEKSYSLMLMPVQNIIAVLNPVMHPVLTGYQDEKAKLESYFYKFVKLLSFVGLPLSVLVYFTSTELVHIILGSQWDPSIVYIKIFSISIGIQIVYSMQGPFFLALNETKKMAICGFITAISIFVAIIIGVILQSINMVAWLVSFSYYLSTVITFYVLIKKCFKSELKPFLKVLTTPLLCTVILIVSLYLLDIYLPEAVWTIIPKILCTLLAYMMTLIITKDSDIIKLLHIK